MTTTMTSTKEQARIALDIARDKFYAAARRHKDTFGDWNTSKESDKSLTELKRLENEFDQAYTHYRFTR